jgi:poly(A) polymerase
VRAAVYRAGQQVVTDRAMMEWAKGGVDDWAGVISVANAWQRPAMPVSGADLLAKGVSEGPDLGATLRRLESDWVDSDFTLGREDLLARV